MWFYNNVPYMCEPEEILETLHNQVLLKLNRDIIRNIKRTSNAIMFTCPWHKDGRESKPSCGLIITQRDDNSIPIGMVHCFACGKVAKLEEFISNCFNIYDGGIFGAKWLSANFTQVELNSRKEIDLSNMLSRNNNKTKNVIKYVSEEELDTYRYIHPYMYYRKLTDNTINIFDIGYDRNFLLNPENPNCFPMECITFPVRDISGNCLFVARRSIHTKLFNYPESAYKPIYGLYELSRYAPSDLDELYICESMLNCTTVWGYGKYAVALNGTGSTNQLEELKKLKYRKIILALDPDDAGINGCKKIYKALKNNKLITRLVIPKGKDINDLEKEEFLNLPQIFMQETTNV